MSFVADIVSALEKAMKTEPEPTEMNLDSNLYPLSDSEIEAVGGGCFDWICPPKVWPDVRADIGWPTVSDGWTPSKD
jgi:hypothetical protein